ncbi:DUF92 domain-containing protein [Bacillus timonensis]|nr:DUF92 domain-containing protein [Bacillus timonensis]
MNEYFPFFIQFFIIIIVAQIGYMFRSLTKSGGLATIFIGICVAIGYSFQGLLLLGAFFASSSVWSKFKREKKAIMEKSEKGDRRDYIQVFANGGVPALISIFSLYYPNEIWLYMFITAIAAANSDTWASEIGSLSRSKPRFIINFKKVDTGTSGAITLLGTMSAYVGALFIAILSSLFWPQITLEAVIVLSIFGFIGNLIDTLLGATIQVSFQCRICMVKTEKVIHCNRKTSYYNGFTFCNNDVVNVLSILLASTLVSLIV